MSEPVKKHLKFAIYIALAVFGVCMLISPPKSFRDFTGCTGISVSITIIISILYEKFAWKLNPLEKTPKLYEKYNGILEYNYNGKIGNKEIEVFFKQSLFHIKVELISNEIISSTITSKIIEENGNYVLYYTYITNPKSKFSDENPIQFGTCRFIVDNPKTLEGIYWTSRETKGDIYLIHSTENERKKVSSIVNTYPAEECLVCKQ